MATKAKRVYLSPPERNQAKARFGNVGCSFAKDSKGFYCYTQRARSNSYPSINKIPKTAVKFIESTG